MLSFSDRVAQSLDSLTTGLIPFVEQALRDRHGEDWTSQIRDSLRGDRNRDTQSIPWDAYSLLTVMWDQWNEAFRGKLGHPERSMVSELREYRNRWAHQTSFDFDDTYRCLDSVERLLRSCAPLQAARVQKLKREMMYEEFSREATEQILESRVRRKKISTIVIYLVCGLALTIALVSSMGGNGWMISTPMNILFVFLSYQVWKERVLIFGPHDCASCGRIIYTAKCPYCRPASFPSVRQTDEIPANPRSSITQGSAFPA